jgi:hypothetical protein
VNLPSRTASLGLLIVFALSACTVTFDPNAEDDRRPTRPDSSSIVVRPTPPEPTAGLPSDDGFVDFDVVPNTIYPGSTIAFRTRVRDDGFLTISAMSPRGRVEVLVRNERVTAGQQVIVPPPGTPPGERIEASEPVGTWRVRAQLSPQRTRATYQRVQGLEDWNEAILEDLRGLDGASVFETYFDVQRR